MRLIDADELIYMTIGEDTDNPFEFVPTEFIKNAEEVDAVPVIRCKDCKHWQCDDNETYCDELGIFNTDMNSYCSYAKKGKK